MENRVFMKAKRGEAAFNLFELLVALAVVAVLAMTLLPAFASVKPNSQALQCLNNMHQWGNAMRLAAADRDDMLPRDGTDDAGQYAVDTGAFSGPGSPYDAFAWFNLAPGYIGDQSFVHYYSNSFSSPYLGLPWPGGKGKVWHCPTARISPSDTFLQNGKYGVFSYVMNLELKVTTPITAGYGKLSYPNNVKIGSTPKPQATVLMTEVILSPTLETVTQTDPNRNGIFPAARSTAFVSRHDAGGYLAFIDGHVAYFKYSYITNGFADASGSHRAEKLNPDVIWNIYRQ